MANDFTVLVLISGRGSNLEALLAKAYHYKIIGVLSDNPDAGGLGIARAANIPCQILAQDKRLFKQDLLQKCKEMSPDLIALAGFMRIIPPDFVDAFYGKIVNIHPALLPKFPGLHTHRRALEAREPKHGCSVHYIDHGVDTGPIIAQASLDVLPEDDEDSLATRVLTMEHELYPWVVNGIAQNRISLREGRTSFDQTALKEAKERGFLVK